MSTPAECWKYAQECVELAQTVKNPRHRTLLLEIAEKWLLFADDATHRPSVEKKGAKDGSDVRR